MLRYCFASRRIPDFWIKRGLSSLENPCLPGGIADSAVVKLPRSVVAVYGEDSHRFLNGLLTIRPPDYTGKEDSHKGIGAYAAMLNAKGRVISDLFVYPAHDVAIIQEATNSKGVSNYLLEIDTRLLEKVLDILDFHVLTMRVQIKELSQFSVWFRWNDANILAPPVSEDIVWTNDNRAPGLGMRFISTDLKGALVSEQRDIDEYRLRRYLFGIPEGAEELIPSKALPLDSCMDYMGGIDFQKGCYLGQELTIRAHHYGNVRKRIMPVVFTTSTDEVITDDVYKPVDLSIKRYEPIVDKSPVPHTELLDPVFTKSPFGESRKPIRSVPPGIVIGAIGNVGLAKLRIDTQNRDLRLGDLHVKPLTPFWWPN